MSSLPVPTDVTLPKDMCEVVMALQLSALEPMDSQLRAGEEVLWPPWVWMNMTSASSTPRLSCVSCASREFTLVRSVQRSARTLMLLMERTSVHCPALSAVK